jgi:hypothetical protein
MAFRQSILCQLSTLTDAQIKTLPTTPVTILVAPSAGFMNRVLAMSLILHASSGAYTNVNTTFASLQLETGTGVRLALGPVNDSTLATPLARLTAFLGAANKAVFVPMYSEAIQSATAGTSGYKQPSVTASLTDYDAQVGRLAINNSASGVLTGGNAANHLTVVIYHFIEPTA